jgi:hypothetical protein
MGLTCSKVFQKWFWVSHLDSLEKVSQLDLSILPPPFR